MTINFIGSATKLADTDLPRLGSLIGVGEDEVHAFLDVETNGGGYDREKRPKMLFEPHKFYAHTSGEARSRAVAAGVAYARQGERPYPADSYPHLLIAIEIDEAAALKSASWGIGQVLGENYVAAGFDSVQNMVACMVSGGEAAQLGAAIAFIKTNHLDDELRAHNWPAFARGYNGPGYSKNGYDVKLAAAYKKWAAIRDTPYPPPSEQTLAMALNATPEKPVVVAPVPSAPAAPPLAAPPPVAGPHIGVVQPHPARTFGQWFADTFFRRAA